MRFLLGLRSSWFSVGALSLVRPAADLLYGSAETLSGLARGVTAPMLESKVGAGAWQQVQALAPAADGSFAVQLQPGVTTFYRITTGTTSGATLRLPVASVVTLAPRRGRPHGDGVARTDRRLPRDAATALRHDLDRRRSRDDRRGRQFTFPTPAPGSYRVRAVTGHGYVPGLSPQLDL